jgi:hypothetical protein
MEANRAAAAARKAAKTTAIQLDFDNLMLQMMSGDPDKFMEEVYTWISPLLPQTAAGLRCPVRRPEEIKQVLSDSAHSKTVQSGGSLSMLRLSQKAFPRLSNSKVLFLLKSWDGMPLSLGTLLGTVLVNADLWTTDTMSDLVRASSDAETPLQHYYAELN